MIECLIIGDSIAVGVGMHRPECETVAKVGITTNAFIGKFSTLPEAKTVVISVGSNDGGATSTHDLEVLRMGVSANRVFWLLSANDAHAAATVRAVAKSFGDFTISVGSVRNDGVHPYPKGYARLAALTK